MRSGLREFWGWCVGEGGVAEGGFMRWWMLCAAVGLGSVWSMGVMAGAGFWVGGGWLE